MTCCTNSYREYIKRGPGRQDRRPPPPFGPQTFAWCGLASDSVTRRNLRLPLAAGSLFAALLFGAAAGAAASAMRNVFIQPREAERTLQIPRLGEFNDQPPDAFDERATSRFAGSAALGVHASAGRPGSASGAWKTLQIIGLQRGRAISSVLRSLGACRDERRTSTLRTLLIDFAKSEDGAPVSPPAGPTD